MMRVRMLRWLLALGVALTTLESGATQECAAAGGLVVQVLGAGGPELDDKHASSAYLIWVDGAPSVLVDAGSGAGTQFEQVGASMATLRAVLFTHLHVDHSAAFPFLVKGSYFQDRQADLPVYGPAGNALVASTTQFIERLFGTSGVYPYLADYLETREVSGSYQITATDVPLEPRTLTQYDLPGGATATAIPVHHGPIAALAWRVEFAGRAVVLSGDTSNATGTLELLAAGADLLVAHNAVPESATGAARHLHMPPSEIGRVAQQAKVGGVVLSHRMQRTWSSATETEAAIRASFQGPLAFAQELDCFAVGKW